MTVGDRIKSIRLELNLSQEELAKKAGYSGKTAISKLENAGNNITMKQIRRVAKALSVTDSYLMGWEDKPSNGAEENPQSDRNKEFIELFEKADPYIQELVVNSLKAAQHKS